MCYLIPGLIMIAHRYYLQQTCYQMSYIQNNFKQVDKKRNRDDEKEGIITRTKRGNSWNWRNPRITTKTITSGATSSCDTDGSQDLFGPLNPKQKMAPIQEQIVMKNKRVTHLRFTCTWYVPFSYLNFRFILI